MKSCVGLAPVRILQVVAAAIDGPKLGGSSSTILNININETWGRHITEIAFALLTQQPRV